MNRLPPSLSQFFRGLVVAAMLVVSSATLAQSTDAPNAVLAENKWAQVTRADYEIELQRLPPDLELDWLHDGR